MTTYQSELLKQNKKIAENNQKVQEDQGKFCAVYAGLRSTSNPAAGCDGMVDDLYEYSTSVSAYLGAADREKIIAFRDYCNSFNNEYDRGSEGSDLFYTILDMNTLRAENVCKELDGLITKNALEKRFKKACQEPDKNEKKKELQFFVDIYKTEYKKANRAPASTGKYERPDWQRLGQNDIALCDGINNSGNGKAYGNYGDLYQQIMEGVRNTSIR